MRAEPPDRLTSSEFSLPARELGLLLKVSSALTSSFELSDVLQTAIEGAVEVLGLDMGVVYLLDDGSLYLGAATPPLPRELPQEHRRARLEDHPHLESCIRESHPYVIEDSAEEDLSEQERIVVESANLVSCIFAPLSIHGRPLGAMIVHTVARPALFRPEDIDLCKTLSHQISLAIANAQLFEAVERSSHDVPVSYDAALRGWSSELEKRDGEWQGHTQRVTDLSVRIGERVGLDGDALGELRRGAMLHDIGNMVVPDHILLKPSALSEAEWVIIRRHPDQAKTMLEGIDVLKACADVPYCHHERWDGSGYPRGLIGDSIPLAARIFAVADVFDALTSARPYRDAWSRSRAIEYIENQSGREFDPRIVQAFLDDVDSGERTGAE